MFEEKIAILNQEYGDKKEEPALDCTEKTVYTPEEIQNILGVSRPTVYKLLKKRPFHILKIGRSIRVPKHEFDVWLDGTEVVG